MEDENLGEHGQPTDKNVTKDKLALISIAVVFVLMFVAFFGPSVALLKNVFGGERQGIIEVGDCREAVFVKEGSLTTYFNTFTCMEEFGETWCCRVEVEEGFCRVAHCYQKGDDISNL